MAEEISVTLGVVTPLFIGGADPRAADARLREPELRATSVRGGLRWWLRALLGGTGWAGPKLDDSEAIWREEAAVFGAAGEGYGASPVLVHLSDERPAGPPKSAQKNPNAGRGRIDGLDYLLYGMHESRGQGARQYFQPDTSFRLTLAPRPGAADSKTAMCRASAALWLLTMLGGLGARSRRGAGCLAPISAEGWEAYGLPAPTIAASPSELRDKLRDGLAKLRSAVKNSNYTDAPMSKNVIPPSSPFSIIHPNYLTIYVLDTTWPSWEAAMREVGEWFATFRRDEVKSDSQAMLSYLDRNTTPQQIERAAFGLPLPFYFPTRQARIEVKPQRREHDRSASPLMFHFSRLSDGKIALALIASYRDLLSPREDMEVGGKGMRPVRLAPPSVDVFGDLADDLRGYIEDAADADFLQVENWRLNS